MPAAAAPAALEVGVGSFVRLAPGYQQERDASGGPLQSFADVGTVIRVDGSDVPFEVRFGERTWWYTRRAVQNALLAGAPNAANAAAASSAAQHLQAGDFVGDLGGMVVRCDDPAALVDLWVLVYSLPATSASTSTSATATTTTTTSMRSATLRASYAVGHNLLVVGPREAMFVFAQGAAISVRADDVLALVESGAMPPGGGVTDDDLALLRVWLACGI